MKKYKFIYAIQAPDYFPKSYASIKNRSFLLSWKTKTDDTHIFAPQTTWTTGRNMLLQHIKDSGVEYDYLVLLDDDIRILLGSFNLFEYEVARHAFKIAVPHDPHNRISMNSFKYTYVNKCTFDACFTCFHKSIVDDGLLLPYDSRFDKTNWWASQKILTHLMVHHYGWIAIQTNKVFIQNMKNRDYPRPNFTTEKLRAEVEHEFYQYVKDKYCIDVQREDIDSLPLRPTYFKYSSPIEKLAFAFRLLIIRSKLYIIKLVNKYTVWNIK